LLHQPERRGLSLSSAVLDTTGSAVGVGGAGGGSDAGPSSRRTCSRRTWAAGSRTVDRRRDRSVAAVSGPA